MITVSNRKKDFFNSARLKWRNWGLGRKLAFSLAGLSVASCIATVITMAGWQNNLNPDPDTVLALLYIDLVLLLLLGVVVARR